MPSSQITKVFYHAAIILMNKFLHIVLGFILVLASLTATASDSTDIAFHITKTRINDSNVLLRIEATIPVSAKLYALQSTQNNTLYSAVEFDSAVNKHLSGVWEEKGARRIEQDSSVS